MIWETLTEIAEAALHLLAWMALGAIVVLVADCCCGPIV